MSTGIFIGKFLPPHRGHLTSILTAYTMCDKLYVLICNRDIEDTLMCREAGLLDIPGPLRKQWLSQELQNFENIKILLVDETGTPAYPNGWAEFSELVKKAVPEKIDLIFGGEPDYSEGFAKYFPNSDYKIIYPEHTAWPISGTEIRLHPHEHWDYIVGSARPFFTKKILITGTESCGKTTLTKMLAKIYNTSWSEEVGRYYAGKFLGGDETIFTDADFARIAHLQFECDYDAMRHANRLCFFDTDALVTDYYSQLYMGHSNPQVLQFVDPNKYDLIMLMTPSVKWVDDGQRYHGADKERWALHQKLKDMYYNRFDTKRIHEITGDYAERLAQVKALLTVFDSCG